MNDNLAQYLQQIELKNLIPKEKERLKWKELEINLFLFLFGAFAVTAHYYPQLFHMGNTDNRLLLSVMMLWFYIQFEYKYFSASYDLAMKVKRRNSLRAALDMAPDESTLSSQPKMNRQYQLMKESAAFNNNSYANETIISI